jgi:hypothetical protein
MTISSLLLGGARASEQMPLNVAGETADPASAMGALVRAMQGGDLVGAQKAYQGLQDQLPAPMAGDKMDAEANAQLNQIGAALRSEDLAGAGRALDVLIRKADAALSTAPGAVEAQLGPVQNIPRLTDKTVGGMVKNQEEAPAESASKPKKPDPTEAFLSYMKKSVAERYIDAWLAAHNLSKEALAAMSPEDRQAVMKRMEEDIRRQIKEEMEKKTGISAPASPDLAELLAKG